MEEKDVSALNKLQSVQRKIDSNENERALNKVRGKKPQENENKIII